MTLDEKRWSYCEHPFDELRFFNQHYRCRECGRSWGYPHAMEAGNPGTRAIVRLEDLDIERTETMRRSGAKS